jgi:hypothetical protein
MIRRRLVSSFPQAGFFKFIVLPLMSAWVKVFPECQPLLTQVRQTFLQVVSIGASRDIKRHMQSP